MTKCTGSLAATVIGLAALVSFAAPTAATAATTTVTFTLTGGSLNVVEGNATFSDASSAPLGNVVVHDLRGATLGWTASAAATVVTASDVAPTVSYRSGPVRTTGTVTASTQGSTELAADAQPVVVGTGITGNNTASWTPTVAVTFPSGAQVGSYAGTVTHSVL